MPCRFATSSGVLRTLVFIVLFITVTSHLIRCLLAEDAGGLDEEDNYQKNKRERIGEHRPVLTEGSDYILADTDYKRTDDSAGDRADAAEDSRNERLPDVGMTDV